MRVHYTRGGVFLRRRGRLTIVQQGWPVCSSPQSLALHVRGTDQADKATCGRCLRAIDVDIQERMALRPSDRAGGGE